jgi:hypothetical protein
MVACTPLAAPRAYQRRRPEETTLYRCVEEHLPAFLAQAEEAERPVPKVVRREFEAYLGCGILDRGFILAQCKSCGCERPVAFSCKKRGFCPSCLGRRMSESAAYFADHIFGEVPVRQWVLSVPPPLRYLLAYDADACAKVFGIFVAAIFECLRAAAKRELGLAKASLAHPAAVSVTQRFGGSLNLNLHDHVLAADGIFMQSEPGAKPVFRALPAPTRGDIMQVAWTTCERAVAYLRKQGKWIDADPGEADRLAQDEPLLSSCYVGAIAGTLILGENAGKRVMRLFGRAARHDADGAKDEPPRNGYGFDVDASVRVRSGDKKGLERLARYIARPPLANDRIERLADGRYRIALTHPWRDGTEAIVLPGPEVIARLVALIPPPHRHLIHFYGAYAPNARLRPLIVPDPPPDPPPACEHDEADTETSRRQRLSWAQLLKRVFDIDLECPRCHSREQRLKPVTDPKAIRAVLAAMTKSTGPP